MAALAGLAILAKYSVSRDPRHFLFGAGLVGVACLDLFHGIMSIPSVVDSARDPESIIALSWLSGRLFLGTIALCAYLVVRPHRVLNSVSPRALLPVMAVSIVALCIASLTIHLSAFMRSTSDFVWPMELISGTIFLAAFTGFARRGIGSLNSVNSWITISLMVDAAIQLMFMSLSKEWLDANYSAAHALKLFSYALISIGVTVDAHHSYRREKLASDELSRVNSDLNQRNLELVTARNELAALTRIAAIASSSTNIEDRFEEFAEELRKQVPADRIVVSTVTDDLSRWRIEAVWGASIVARHVGDHLPIAGTLMEDVLVARKTVMLDDKSILEALQRDRHLRDDLDAGFRSWISTPVIASGRVIGGLLVRSTKPDAYSSRDAQFLEQVAAQIAGPLSVSRTAQGFHYLKFSEGAA